MHKNPPSSRPIVPTHSWGTMRLSKVLSYLLRPFLEQTPWVVKDIAAVKAQLSEFPMLPDTEYALVTGDVSSLYTNIPLPDGYKAIRDMTRNTLRQQYLAQSTAVNHFRCDLEIRYLVDFFANMTRFVMLHNYFRSGNRLFQQTKGTAMGTNMAPEFANIYMAVAEQAELFNTDVIEGCLYLRYIDDILVVGPRNKLDQLVQQSNFLNLPLTINWLEVTTRLPFLDLELMLRDGQLVYELYRKPINTYQYIEWDSAHPFATKKGFVTGEVLRILRNCSERETALKHIDFFHARIRARGYPPHLTNKWIQSMLRSTRPENDSTTDITRYQSPEPDEGIKTFYLKVEYDPVWESDHAPPFKRHLEQLLNTPGFINFHRYLRHHRARVLISKKRSRNIMDYANAASKAVLHNHFDSALSHVFTLFDPAPEAELNYRSELADHRTHLLRRLGFKSAKRVREGLLRHQIHKKIKRVLRSRRRKAPLWSSTSLCKRQKPNRASS